MAFTATTYCQADDVINAMTSNNAAGTPAEINPAVVQLAITQASSKVSAWTSNTWGIDGKGNAVPVPPIIQSITINVAAYYATLSYRKNKPLETNDPVLLRYQDAVSDLTAIMNNQITPDPDIPGQPTYGRGAIRNTIPRTFTGYDTATRVGLDGRLRVQDYDYDERI